MENIALEIGQNIRSLRKKHNLNQEKFGELIGVNAATISKYENGRDVNAAQLVELSKVLKVSINEILYGPNYTDEKQVLLNRITELEKENNELKTKLLKILEESRGGL